MMTNRNNLCIVCLLMLLCLSSTALAESFTVEGLRYNTLSATTVEVVKPESGKYSGDITIPAVVTHNETTYRITAIGDNAFQGANQVTSVTLPLTSVKSIGEYAFNDCTGLTEFTLPESITSIGKNAFYYCDKLKHLYVHSKDPASYNVGSNAFSNINRGGNVCTLHVPTGCTAAYAADATFSVFTQVEEFDAPISIRYNLYAAGEQVNSLNASDILGDGAASYDAEKNILTLRDDIAAPDASTSCIMNEIENLTIQVAAPVTLSAKGAAILVDAKTTITGSSLLKMITPIKGVAIYSLGADLSIVNANIEAEGCIENNGGYGHSDLIITNSSVTVETTDDYGAISDWVDLSLNDCYIKTPEDGYYDGLKIVDSEGVVAKFMEIVPTKAPMSGDADGNDEVNAADIVAIVNFIMGNPPVVFYQTAADINEDGKINIADIVMLSNIIMGK